MTGLDAETRERLRQALLGKGGEVARALAEVLAGRDLDLSQLGAPREGPGKRIRPEERLRAFLDLIGERRRLIEADDARYVQCATCGGPLTQAELEAMPWATACQRCAGA